MITAWRLTADAPDIASVRYRCLTPARQLRRHGIDYRLSWGADDPLRMPTPDALVFVKAVEPHDVALAERAARAGVPIVLDLCDNVFSQYYAAGAAEGARRIAELASRVVTTGAPLAGKIREELPGSPVEEIPDPVETPDDVRFAGRALWRERVRNGRAAGPLRLARTVGGAAYREIRRPLPLPVPRGRIPRVIWFGNAGSITPRFGLVNLVDIASELEEAMRDEPFELLVVTSDREAYEQLIRPLPLRTAFARWHRRRIFQLLRSSTVGVLPNSLDEFSLHKSPNRAVLALANGVPVVATRTPALAPFDGCATFDDFAAGVTGYLRDPALGRSHVERASRVIEERFGAAAVAERWRELLTATG